MEFFFEIGNSSKKNLLNIKREFKWELEVEALDKEESIHLS